MPLPFCFRFCVIKLTKFARNRCIQCVLCVRKNHGIGLTQGFIIQKNPSYIAFLIRRWEYSEKMSNNAINPFLQPYLTAS